MALGTYPRFNRGMRTTTSRRQFLRAGLAAPFLGPVLFSGQDPSPEPRPSGRKLLVLGGTRFLGPAIVEYALAQGYEVTLFNRGKSNPDMFPDLEKLRGDRNTGDLAALESGKWDAVVDTSCYLPSHARQAAEILRDRVGHYVMISTISVYGEVEGDVVDEDAPVGEITEENIAKVQSIGDVMKDGGVYYGPLKALCEQALEELMPGRVTSLRPGVIAGKDDPSDRLPYWVVRCHEGGEVLCPGNPDQDFQFTDVKDLGRWSVDFGMAKTAGIFNAVGFDGRVSLQEFLHGCKIVLGNTKTSFTWCDEEFLLENEVRPFSELPFWLPAAWAHHYATERGVAAGMTFSPIADSIRDVIEWHLAARGEGYEWRYYGMGREREAELLVKWHARGDEDEGAVEAAGEADSEGAAE